VTTRADRHSARVIVVDETGGVLLFRIVDAEDTKPPVWITPGGGIQPDEGLAEAARRELREETGVDAAPERLTGPIAVCRGEWEFRGRPLFSEDWFFALRMPRFAPSDAGWEDHERELHHSWRWWTADELDAADELVLPLRLADVVRGILRDDLGPGPLELPWSVV
jgi:8-oxo-dGTP pyrophosphatase MutT (NUDIX family)